MPRQQRETRNDTPKSAQICEELLYPRHLFGRNAVSIDLLTPCVNSNGKVFIEFEVPKVYLMFDSVHLMTNVRNHLFIAKRLIFSSFNFNGLLEEVNVTEGNIYIGLYCIKFTNVTMNYMLICERLRNLLSILYIRVINEQDVQRALNFFHATTGRAIKEYFPAEKSSSKFLKLFQTWWTI